MTACVRVPVRVPDRKQSRARPLDERGRRVVELVLRPGLVIEVSDSSLRYDRITKGRLYARRGIVDSWILNVKDATVEVLRDPDGEAWATRTVHRAGETLRPLLLPDVSIELGPLLAFNAGSES